MTLFWGGVFNSSFDFPWNWWGQQAHRLNQIPWLEIESFDASELDLVFQHPPNHIDVYLNFLKFFPSQSISQKSLFLFISLNPAFLTSTESAALLEIQLQSPQGQPLLLDHNFECFIIDLWVTFSLCGLDLWFCRVFDVWFSVWDLWVWGFDLSLWTCGCYLWVRKSNWNWNELASDR